MTDQEIAIAANAIAGLMDATGSDLDYILECLTGNIISDEDCGRIKERMAM